MAVLRKTAAGQFMTGPSDNECLTGIPDGFRPPSIADGLADFGFTASAWLLSSQVGSYVLLALASTARVPVKSTALSDLSARDFLLMLEDPDLKSCGANKFSGLSPWESVTGNGI